MYKQAPWLCPLGLVSRMLLKKGTLLWQGGRGGMGRLPGPRPECGSEARVEGLDPHLFLGPNEVTTFWWSHCSLPPPTPSSLPLEPLGA